MAARESCWYGAECFRRNEDHKTEYAHPGDADYDGKAAASSRKRNEKSQDEDKKPAAAAATSIPSGEPALAKSEGKPSFSFQVESGEVLWGQGACLLQGWQSSGVDTRSGPVSKGFGGGTILQSSFQFRSRARRGTWLVRKLRSAMPEILTTRYKMIDHPAKAKSLSPEEAAAEKKRAETTLSYHTIGYLVHHADQDPVAFTKAAQQVGISHHQVHEDKSIVYVNRYDWSYHGCQDSAQLLDIFQSAQAQKNEQQDQSAAAAAEADASSPKRQRTAEDAWSGDGFDENDPSHQADRVKGAHCVLLDAAAFAPQLLLQLSDRPKSCFHAIEQGDKPVGCCLADPYTEYELAWLKLDKNPESHADELVAFIYDSSYSSLELQPHNSLYVDDLFVVDAQAIEDHTLALEQDEDPDYDPEEEEDPDYDPKNPWGSNSSKAFSWGKPRA